MGEESACNAGDPRRVQSLGQEDHLEEGMATHSSVLAWKIPWTEELGGLRPIGWQKLSTYIPDYTILRTGLGTAYASGR